MEIIQGRKIRMQRQLAGLDHLDSEARQSEGDLPIALKPRT